MILRSAFHDAQASIAPSRGEALLLSPAHILNGLFQTPCQHLLLQDMTTHQTLPGTILSPSFLQTLVAHGVRDLYLQCPTAIQPAAQDLANRHLDKTSFINEVTNERWSRSALANMAETIHTMRMQGLSPHFITSETLETLEEQRPLPATASAAEEMAHYFAKTQNRAEKDQIYDRAKQGRSAWLLDGRDEHLPQLLGSLPGGVIPLALTETSHQAAALAATTQAQLVFATQDDKAFAGAQISPHIQQALFHLDPTAPIKAAPSTVPQGEFVSERNLRTPAPHTTTSPNDWYSPPLSISLG